jgi:ribonuclease P/MRP protein subunit POP5
MRLRQRYLAVRLLTLEQLPSESTFRNAIWKQLQGLYGELGVSQIGFWLTAYDPEKQRAIIRCQHTQVRPLRAALASIRQIESISLLFHVVGVSGSIRKALTHLPELDPQNVIRPRKHR